MRSSYQVVLVRPQFWPVLDEMRAAFTAERSGPLWPETPAQRAALSADTAASAASVGAASLMVLFGDNPVGFISSVTDGLPWLSERVLYVNGFWIHPDHRKGSAGFLLLRAFVRLARGLPKGSKVRAYFDPTNQAIHYGRLARRLGVPQQHRWQVVDFELGLAPSVNAG